MSSQFFLYTRCNLRELFACYSRERCKDISNFRAKDLFQKEIIGIPTIGMRTWLKQELINDKQNRHMIANVDFIYPRKVIDAILSYYFKDSPQYRPDLFLPETLAWRIYTILIEVVNKENCPKEFFKLKKYINFAIDEYALLHQSHQNKNENNVNTCPVVDDQIASNNSSKSNSSKIDLEEIESEHSDRTKSIYEKNSRLYDLLSPRAWQLALKLADVYFDYMSCMPDRLYPDLMAQLFSNQIFAETEKVIFSEEDQWQLSLWKLLCKDKNGNDLLSPAEATLRLIDPKFDLDARRPYCPITVFGISAMPPFFLRILQKVSERSRVNFFITNPMNSSWKSYTNNDQHDECSFDKIFHESLVGNFGRQNYDFFKAVLTRNFEHWDKGDGESFSLPNNSILHKIQNDLQCDLFKYSVDNQNFSLEPQDDSLTIHNCFNDVRQIEVLHDCLLGLIRQYQKENREIDLNDIMVIAPDIARFAPIIQSVFDHGPLKDAFCINGRSLKTTNFMADALLNIIQLYHSDFEIKKIAHLLTIPALYQRFGLDEKGCNLLRNWFVKANIKKGRLENANMEFSWRIGLDRMLLNIAMENNENDELGFAGMRVAEFSDSEEDLLTFGYFLQMFKKISDFVKDLDKSRTGEEWCDFLEFEIKEIFKIDQNNTIEYSQILKIIRTLRHTLKMAECLDCVISVDFLCEVFSNSFEISSSRESYFNHQIVFSSPQMVRALPCKIIVLLGMEQGQFPLCEEVLGFDYMRKNMLRFYDRSQTDEDRATFLETILAAEDYFLIFYNGRDDRSGKKYLPAAPVCELRDHLKIIANTDLEVKHPLNAYDVNNFITQDKDTFGLLRTAFSFDSYSATTAKIITESEKKSYTFSNGILELPHLDPLPFPLFQREDGIRELTLDISELEIFLKNSIGQFMTKRLGFPIKNFDEKKPDNYPPLVLDNLQKYNIQKKICDIECDLSSLSAYFEDPEETLDPNILALNNETRTRLQKYFECAKAEYTLPIGELGEIAFRKTLFETWINDDSFRVKFAKQQRSKEKEHCVELDDVKDEIPIPEDYTDSKKQPPIPPDEALQKLFHTDHLLYSTNLTVKVNLTGKFRSYSDQNNEAGIYDCTFSKKIKGKHLILTYLKHLLLCAENSTPHINFCSQNYNSIDIKMISEFDSTQAREQLRKIVQLYLVGHRMPLPLFPNASVQASWDLLSKKDTKLTEDFESRFKIIYPKFIDSESEELKAAVRSFGLLCYKNITSRKSKK